MYSTCFLAMVVCCYYKYIIRIEYVVMEGHLCM